MVQIIQETGNIAGRIGRGFGKGLSEQIPKEMERYRLSSGLEKLNKEGANLSPIQQTAGLIKSGFTPEQVSSFLPVLRESQQTAAYRKNFGKPIQEVPQAKQADITEKGKPISAIEPQGKGGFASASQLKNYKQSIQQEPSKEDVRDLAIRNIESGIALNERDAEAQAYNELKQNLVAQREKLGSFRTGLETRLTNDLQKGGFAQFQDVSGEIKNALLDQGEYLVGVKGLTPEAAQQEIADIGKELGKTVTQTKTTGAISNWLKPSSEKTRELREQKKQFDKYGFGEQFDDIATSALGITPMQAAAVLDPLKNKDINKVLDPLKSTIFVDVRPLPKKTLDSIIENIEPDDNILSIAHKLRDKRYDVNQFLERVSELEDEGKIALTPKQQRQRQKPSSNSMLGDILYNTL